ncbi:pleckstrin homology-like domain family B member 3 [Lepisosteus oculatus]|uniref:pleckstrin homology-like domain family B member 3 n=1 Tax=Lepisosteus oculatus TaxID=7918 RepID=UPI0037179794
MPQHNMNTSGNPLQIGSPLVMPTQVARREAIDVSEVLECSSGSASSPSSGEETDSEESSSTESSQTRTENSREDPAPVHPAEVEHTQDAALVSRLQRRIKDMDQQREELKLEMQMERALLEGELQTEQEELTKETQRLDTLQEALRQQEMRFHSERQQEKMRLQAERQRVDELRQRQEEFQRQVETQPESLREQLRQRLQEEREALDGEVRAFEDLEFHFLERESVLEEERESAHRKALQDISQQQHRVNSIKERVIQLRDQVRQVQKQSDKELQRLSQGRKDLLKCLHMHLLKDKKQLSDLGHLAGSAPCMLSLSPLSIHRPGQNLLPDMNAMSSLQKRRSSDKNCKPPDRPVSVHGRLLTTMDSYPQPTCPPEVTVSELHSTDTSKSPPSSPLSQANGFLSYNGSITLNNSVTTSQASSPGQGVPNIEEIERKLREAKAERERLLRVREAKKRAEEEAKKRAEEEAKKRAEEEARQKELESSPPPSPESELSSLGSSVEASPPPFRSLISCEAFDLRGHLEALGHGVETCQPVAVTHRKCKGFLTKMGGKIKTWKKRWFVFDGEKKRLAYFADKEETKLKGVIYFQAIEEVYYDHLRSASKSPHPKLTFCVKTYDRLFFMVAPTAEAMRIWMDVIVTATDEHGRY